MAQIETLHHAGSVIRFDRDAFDTFVPRLFEVDWLRNEGVITGSAPGRGTAHFISFETRDMVLRHYFRGGLIARFNKNLYLRIPTVPGRAFQEFALLDWMRNEGLPVPRPLAARQMTQMIWYKADILVERIPDAKPLDECLLQSSLNAQTWRAIGDVIARFHKHGVCHTDLNCRNILLDESGKIWLIDFDKCSRRKPGGWEDGNIERLERSLKKVKSKNIGLNWTDDDWSSLVAGYHATR